MTVAHIKAGTGKNNTPPGLVNPKSHNVALVLTADTVSSIAVPANADACVFSSQNSFWADVATILTVNPIAEVTDGSGPILNPQGFVGIDSDDTIYLRSSAAATVGIQFYSLGGVGAE